MIGLGKPHPLHTLHKSHSPNPPNSTHHPAMQCKLVGNFVQHLEATLAPGEEFYAEKGVVIYLEGGIEKEVSLNGSGLRRPQDLADKIINELQVKTPDTHTAVRKLSGGNVQKVLVGREIAAAPAILMTAYPVRGLDINSSYTIYNLLNEQKQKGVSVIYVGEDLDILMALSDRILVLSGGKVSGIVDARTTTKDEIGLMMVQSNKSEVTE